jgi:hypothetical protein|tara:strand:+ start:379 stop:567 length:189 start_codon:yes stop_codon:yes gene_type:complete
METKRDYMMKDFAKTPLGKYAKGGKASFKHLMGGYKYDHISGGSKNDNRLDKSIRQLDTYNK